MVPDMPLKPCARAYAVPVTFDSIILQEGRPANTRDRIQRGLDVIVAQNREKRPGGRDRLDDGVEKRADASGTPIEGEQGLNGRLKKRALQDQGLVGTRELDCQRPPLVQGPLEKSIPQPARFDRLLELENRMRHFELPAPPRAVPVSLQCMQSECAAVDLPEPGSPSMSTSPYGCPSQAHLTVSRD